jgi:tetratricopeptide (TPR) repeat protein
MSFWRRLFGGSSPGEIAPQRLDYLNEALALERQGDFEAALTSYRLALRDHPNDARILQNMAIAFTKTGRVDEAIRHYRRSLELDKTLAGAHYGLAFLLLKRGDPDGAANKPNRRGLAVITYIQWLGSWLKEYPYYENYKSIEQLEQSMLEAGAD